MRAQRSIPNLQQVLLFIEHHIKDEIRVQDLADIAGYAPSQFHVLFRQSVGQTPADYVRNRRLAHACWDVVFSRYRIIDTALDYQFSSQEAFTRAFKRRFGINPGAFKRQSFAHTTERRREMRDVKEFPAERILEGVPRVGFYRGGDQCPEDIPFPSCMASVMRYLGEDYPWLPLEAHGRTWRLNFANVYFLGVTGMAFGFLWRGGWHLDNVDHMFVADPREIIDRAFKSAGYAYRIVEKRGDDDGDAFAQHVVSSINDGRPVLAFGVIGPPECCLITGYRDHGTTVFGWNYFQDDEEWNAGVTEMENGYFSKADWVSDTRNLVVVDDKFSNFDSALGPRSVLEWALHIMNTRSLFGRFCGFAALDVWKTQLVDDTEFDGLSPSELQQKHQVHDNAVGIYAECRAWADHFMMYFGQKHLEIAAECKRAGGCFADIHDLMWVMWDHCGGHGNPDGWKKFGDPSVRNRLFETLQQAIDLDRDAASALGDAIAKLP